MAHRALATPYGGPGAGTLTSVLSIMVFPPAVHIGTAGFRVKRAGVKKRSLAGHVSEDAWPDFRLSRARWGVAVMRQDRHHEIGVETTY